MNIVKKMAIAAAVLCAVTVANAEEGMQIGGRVGYSVQGVSGTLGTLGVSAGVVANIPLGPVTVGPEAAFIYRNNGGDQTEMGVSIPVLFKWFPMEGFYVQAGIQADLPLGAKAGDVDMDGKETEIDLGPFFGGKMTVSNPKRATLDLGIPIGVGYFVMPNLSVDARYVVGLLPHSTTKTVLGEIESDPLMTIVNVGVTYFF